MFCGKAALVAVALAVSACGDRRGSPPADFACTDCDLVLISIDTLRADHLSSYGYPRPTSPNIDLLAASGVRFSAAYSSSYHTAESHMSMFTATAPSVHRVSNTTDAREAKPLAGSIQTLPERLASASFETVGFHGGGNVSAPYGFGRGFATYRATSSDVEPAVAWLEERRRAGGGRFFLFFHTYRPHDPYLPDAPYNELWAPDYRGGIFWRKEEFEKALPTDDFAAKRNLFWSRVDRARPEDVEKLAALYDGEIRQADEDVGRLLRAVDALGRKVLVALVSDHGEEFFEHGKHLHDQVFEECLHVPWIVRHPAGAGAGLVVGERVSLVDLAPTLLDLLGAPPLDTAQGRSLRPLLQAADRKGASPRSWILAEKVVGEPGRPGELPPMKQALILGDWKLIRFPEGRSSLFNLIADPEEKLERAHDESAVRSRLEETLARANGVNQKLAERLAASGSSAPAPLSEEEIESLRALGYLN